MTETKKRTVKSTAERIAELEAKAAELKNKENDKARKRYVELRVQLGKAQGKIDELKAKQVTISNEMAAITSQLGEPVDVSTADADSTDSES